MLRIQQQWTLNKLNKPIRNRIVRGDCEERAVLGESVVPEQSDYSEDTTILLGLMN